MERVDGGRPDRWAILFTVLVMTFMVCLDSSVVTVALPVMQRELGVGLSQIQWVSSAYLIVVCLLVLWFGGLGDSHGKVRVFQAGVATFTAGSLACGMSPTLSWLVAARVLQGVGAAMAMANNMGIITEAFPARERGRAMGLLSTFVALGMMAGPMLGGALVSAFPWESIFLINVPVGVASFLVGLRTLPCDEAPAEKDGAGRGSAWPLYVFRNPDFVLNLATMLITFVGIGAAEFTIPFFLQQAHGLTPAAASLAFLALPVTNAVAGPVSGSVSDHVGGEVPTMVGLGIYVCALLGMSRLTPQTPMWLCVIAMGCMSLGSSSFQSPNNALFMASAPAEALGFAGSVGGLGRYLGMAVGTMGGSALLYGCMGVAAGYPVSAYVAGRPDIFMFGYRAVFLCLASLAAVGFALTVWRFVRTRRAN
ncbi:MFS transporter [Atopobiaceae bacterium LCP21S3_F11]